MYRVKEPVNWSAIACQAFEDRLGEIAAKKEMKNMEDVVERLRKSRRESDSEQYRSGRQAGKLWASDWADAVQLKRIERLHDTLRHGLSYDWDWWFTSTDQRFVPRSFAEEIEPDNEYREFWQVISDTDPDNLSDEFVKGVAEGALDVWLEVKDLL
jgi:hypothetical protein